DGYKGWDRDGRGDRGPGMAPPPPPRDRAGVAPPPPAGRDWRGVPDDQRRWDDRRRWDGVRRPPPPAGDWRSERDDPRARFGFSRPGSPGIWRSERDQRWDREWRREPRYDWRGYRAERRSLFRLPRYYAPYGWDGGYRRFGLGVPLAPMLYTPRYWIYDPWAYRLPDADEPYRWVRYYNDALLVDIEDGTVVDVIYGIFE
ncbi:RcnB family protein, partial [Sphingomonas endophytica]